MELAPPKLGIYKAVIDDTEHTLYLTKLDLSDNGLWSAFLVDFESSLYGECFIDDWLELADTWNLTFVDELPAGLLEQLEQAEAKLNVEQIP